MSDPEQVWVLYRQRVDSDTISLMGVYGSETSLNARLEKVWAANPQYEPEVYDYEPDRYRVWKIGPDEDEGFFGHRPMLITASLVGYQP
jgi:hypothetical protein